MVPLLSIVVPLYNKAPFIKATLESILCQGAEDFEVIVVNDGSTDGGEDVVNQIVDSRIRLISQPNRGVSAARNLGIAQSRGEWIYLLDGDDLMMPNALKEVIPLLKSGESDVIITSYAHSRNGMIAPAKPRMKAGSLRAPLLNKFIGRFKYVTGSIFVKSNIAKKFKFDTALRRYEDDQVYCQWFMSGSVYFCPIVMMCYNHEGNSASLINQDNFESDYLAHLIFLPGKFWYNANMGKHMLEAYRIYPNHRAELNKRYGLRQQFYRCFAILSAIILSLLSVLKKLI